MSLDLVLKRLGRGAAFGALAGGLALLVGSSGFPRTVEMKLYDWRTRIAAGARAAAADPDIVLVNIDDDSLKRMEPLVGRWPWPRLVHATLIDYLAAGGAKAILYDVLFAEADRAKFMVGETEWTGAESDQALVDATARAGNVVHVAEAASAELVDPSRAVATRLDDIPGVNRPFTVSPCAERRPQITPPFSALAKASPTVSFAVRP